MARCKGRGDSLGRPSALATTVAPDQTDCADAAVPLVIEPSLSELAACLMSLHPYAASYLISHESLCVSCIVRALRGMFVWAWKRPGPYFSLLNSRPI